MDAQTLATLILALTSAQSAAPPAAPALPIGKRVVIRDHMAGVYCGTLTAIDLATGTWMLADARQAWSWTGAAATPGLASRGPTGGKIGPVRPVCGRALVACIEATPEAAAAWDAQPVWTP